MMNKKRGLTDSVTFPTMEIHGSRNPEQKKRKQHDLREENKKNKM